LPFAPPDAPRTATARCQAELAQLVQRLVRLVQEMGDRGLEPEVYPPARELRPTYLRLTAEAVCLLERLGLSEGHPVDHLRDLLVAQLRSTSRSERREQLSLQQALGEEPSPVFSAALSTTGLPSQAYPTGQEGHGHVQWA
jgi:hypothetical protein